MSQNKRVRNYSRREPIVVVFMSDDEALRLTAGCPAGYRSAEVERQLVSRWRDEWQGAGRADGWLVVMRPKSWGALPLPEMVVRMWSASASRVDGGAL